MGSMGLVLFGLLIGALILIWANRARLLQARGGAALRAENPQAALDLLAKATALNPSLDKAWFQMGQCCFLLKRYAEAVTHFQRAIQTNPAQTALVTYNIGLAHDHLGDHEAARRAFAQCVALEAENAKAHWHLARQLMNLGDLEAADKALSTALRLAPDFDKAQATRAELNQRRAS